jgi:hypothetical protein
MKVQRYKYVETCDENTTDATNATILPLPYSHH